MPSVRLWIYAFTSLYFTAGVPLQAAPFLRGDANAGGEVDISDAISTLAFLFSGSRAPACSDAADANDDGRIDITDPIFTLDFLFLGGVVPPAPYPACGPDLTPDELDCEAYAAAGCETLPALVEVRALSRHFVLAVFDAPVDAALLDPENFSIAGPGGAPLRIAGASREPSDPTKVLLATGEQEAVEYRLDLTSPLLAPAPAGGLNFQGSRLAEPFLAYAISLGSTSTEGKVLLTFSEAMASSALDIRFYQITNPDLRILRAEYGTVATANSTVLLTTEPQEEVEYTVR